jgi:hypothetical protein
MPLKARRGTCRSKHVSRISSRGGTQQHGDLGTPTYNEPMNNTSKYTTCIKICTKTPLHLKVRQNMTILSSRYTMVLAFHAAAYQANAYLTYRKLHAQAV